MVLAELLTLTGVAMPVFVVAALVQAVTGFGSVLAAVPGLLLVTDPARAVVGANGTVGSAAAAALEDQGHEVVRASRSVQVAVDISDPQSIRSLYQQVGQVDAVACAAGVTPPRGIRINAVSPTVLSESWEKYGPSFPGFRPVPAAEVGRAYVKSVDGAQSGQTYRVGW